MAIKEIKFEGERVGYGLNDLNNISSNIKDISKEIERLKGNFTIDKYSVVTEKVTIKCSSKSSSAIATVQYTKNNKTTTKKVSIDTSRVKNKIESIYENLHSLNRRISDLESIYASANNNLKIAIKEFRNIDKDAAKIIDDKIAKLMNIKSINTNGLKDIKEEDISSIYMMDINNISKEDKEAIEKEIEKLKADDHMGEIHVIENGDGSLVILKTRRVKPDQIEAVISNKFSTDVGNRKYKLDYLIHSKSDSIILENGDILTRDENGMLTINTGNKIVDSTLHKFDGADLGISEIGKTNYSHTIIGDTIPIGVSGGVGFAEANAGPLKAEANLANAFIGVVNDVSYDEGTREVLYKIGASASLMSGEIGIDNSGKNVSWNGKTIGLDLSVSADLGVGANVIVGSSKNENDKLTGIIIGADLKCLLGIEFEIDINWGWLMK